MQAGRGTEGGKSIFPFKQIFPSVHHTLAKLVQLNLKVFRNISISANFQVFIIFKKYFQKILFLNLKQYKNSVWEEKIAISAICLTTFRPRRDQLIPNLYGWIRMKSDVDQNKHFLPNERNHK